MSQQANEIDDKTRLLRSQVQEIKEKLNLLKSRDNSERIDWKLVVKDTSATRKRRPKKNIKEFRERLKQRQKLLLMKQSQDSQNPFILKRSATSSRSPLQGANSMSGLNHSSVVTEDATIGMLGGSRRRKRKINQSPIPLTQSTISSSKDSYFSSGNSSNSLTIGELASSVGNSQKNK
eukprot:TRINITY_DN18_c0_g2_i1.p1 TRINITY_DN18_c0_g2~~TRINITY_DN18_c0_g2_i1.p1  ORF type:complete len:178 (-),score=5.34 TRINITY_DN18_c0_g2_i1:489-1022(-)